ncbi:hypothetical protein [Pseudomonas laurylsulfatiphila]
MTFYDQVKAFGMTNMLLETDLEEIEKSFDIKIKSISEHSITTEIEAAYFPQFEKSLRKEAADMAKNYELFYCLEKTIRKQISELLEAHHGDKWWNDKIIPQHIVGEVKKRVQAPLDALSNHAYYLFARLAVLKSTASVPRAIATNVQRTIHLIFRVQRPIQPSTQFLPRTQNQLLAQLTPPSL